MRGVQNLGLARRTSFNFAYVYANPAQDLSQIIVFLNYYIYFVKFHDPGGKADKSYGLGSGGGRPKNNMVWGVGPEGRKIIWSGEWAGTVKKLTNRKQKKRRLRRDVFLFSICSFFLNCWPTPQTI